MVLSLRQAEALGANARFPEGHDPVGQLKKLGVEVVQTHDSQLTLYALQKGFQSVKTSERRLWLADVEDGRFKLKGAENHD